MKCAPTTRLDNKSFDELLSCRMLIGVRSCSHVPAYSACFNRQLTVAVDLKDQWILLKSTWTCAFNTGMPDRRRLASRVARIWAGR